MVLSVANIYICSFNFVQVNMKLSRFVKLYPPTQTLLKVLTHEGSWLRDMSQRHAAATKSCVFKRRWHAAGACGWDTRSSDKGGIPYIQTCLACVNNTRFIGCSTSLRHVPASFLLRARVMVITPSERSVVFDKLICHQAFFAVVVFACCTGKMSREGGRT